MAKADESTPHEGRESLDGREWSGPEQELVLDPPPRKLSLRARGEAHFGGGGAAVLLFMLVFAAMGTFALFASEAMTPFLFRGTRVQTRGEVLGVARTWLSENDVDVWAVNFEVALEGRVVRATSYRRGESSLRPGDLVEVEVAGNARDRAIIRGYRYRPLGLGGALLGAIFILVGIGLPLWLAVPAWRTVQLLSIGRLAWAIPIAREATKDSDGDWSFQLEYEFVAPPDPVFARGSEEPGTARRLNARVGRAEYERLTGAWVIFDPRDDRRAALVSTFGRVRFVDGRVVGGRLWLWAVPVLYLGAIVASALAATLIE